MVHKFCFEALNRTLRDILQFDNENSHSIPFGGKKKLYLEVISNKFYLLYQEVIVQI